MDALKKNFAFEGEKNSVDYLYDDKDVMIVSIDLFHVDDVGECNKNLCNISREAAEKSIDTIKNKPIIFRYNSICKDFVSDVTDHAHDEKEAFEMKIAGHIPADSRITFIERENGKTYCNAEAVIHKKYVPQLVQILMANDGNLKVSIEIMAKGEENEDGIFVIDFFSLQGVCLLGKNVEEGIEGSHLEVLKFSKKEIDVMNKKYLKFSKSQESNQTIFDKIKNKIGEKDMTEKEFSIGLNELNNKIWEILHEYMYDDPNGYKENKFFVEEIYPDEKYIIVRDNEKVGYFKMTYTIEGGKVIIDVDGKVEVEKDWHERPLSEERFSIIFAKEEYGTGEAIKVDKSKEAMSDKAWGEVDKTELRKKVLKAKNYKTLVKDVYAEVEEGWEDAPSEKLKYPIMLIEGDTAVYARYGLASALGYAKAENNTSVVDKVEKLYETINIKEKEEEMSGEKELQNKLDKDNPEIEAIRDDADAIEDDEKEELRKKEEEVDNAVVDAPEEDKLKDDIDSDKDYWKKKFEELEPKYNSCLEELKVYKDKEDKAEMLEYLQSFKKCFSDDDLKVMASKIAITNKCDFEKEIDDKVKEFVRNMSKAEDEEKKAKEELEMNNSVGTFINPNKDKKSGNQMRTIDDVLDSYN